MYVQVHVIENVTSQLMASSELDLRDVLQK